MAKHPIIANGEMYAEPVTKALGGGPKVLPRDYVAAKQRVIGALDDLTRDIADSSEVFLNERIICIRLEPKFEAKSYIPSSVIGAMSNGASQIVGGRKYTVTEGENEVSAKLYFVRTTDNGLGQLKQTLQNGDRDNVEQWQSQLRSINTINLLKPEEKVMGFEEDWESGTVEFVLHPVPSSTEEEISTFFAYSGISEENARVKTYDDGITFISASCTNEHIQRVKGYNPLRAAHPMGSVSITPMRSIPGSTCPSVRPSSKKPEIRVGVFDGGADDSIPLLKDYVSAIDCASEPAIQQLIEHGSGVCSAILYGSLSGKKGTDILDPPCVGVDCYRVLPLRDRRDFDLYEVIDHIENIVPNAKHTKLYNLSMGPKGAIVDDSISRFTYALDKLAYEVPEGEDNPLFVVAVGNDGEMPPNFNRIQSPADIINGLGVGAYTYAANGEKTPASYSCVGPGREGAKTKPDLLDFGGNIDHPFIVPSLDHQSLSATAGTSFASPMVTGKIGRLMAMSSRVSPHMGRTLMIHNAKTINSLPKDCQGFGCCTDNVSEVLECSDKCVTVMYSGTILPKQYLNLPAFMPRINEMSGNVDISWTVSVVVAPYANDPDAYTNNCLEDVFCPHSMKYHFTKKGEKTQTVNLLDESKIAMVRHLLDSGYKRSSTPVSHAAKTVWEEEDLRTVDLKWDTVIHKTVTMRSSSLFDPCLTLHAIGRNGFETEPIKYNVAITVNAPRYQGSLYDAILQTYQNLAPIDIRNINRLMIE